MAMTPTHIRQPKRGNDFGISNNANGSNKTGTVGKTVDKAEGGGLMIPLMSCLAYSCCSLSVVLANKFLSNSSRSNLPGF
jgi:hypothetical protein